MIGARRRPGAGDGLLTVPGDGPGSDATDVAVGAVDGDDNRLRSGCSGALRGTVPAFLGPAACRRCGFRCGLFASLVLLLLFRCSKCFNVALRGLLQDSFRVAVHMFPFRGEFSLRAAQGGGELCGGGCTSTVPLPQPHTTQHRPTQHRPV